MSAHELELQGIEASFLHQFACECVERVLATDTPDLCRDALAAKRHWLDTGDPSRLSRAYLDVEATLGTERSKWLDSGIPAIALGAVLAALADDPRTAARGAAAQAQKLASQRGFARSGGVHTRERGDDADMAAFVESEWQDRRIEAFPRTDVPSDPPRPAE